MIQVLTAARVVVVFEWPPRSALEASVASMLLELFLNSYQFFPQAFSIKMLVGHTSVVFSHGGRRGGGAQWSKLTKKAYIIQFIEF